jgi:CRP-like cAMP-binding protein
MALDGDTRAVPLFARMSPDQLRRVAARAGYVDVGAGEALFSQGEDATRFFVVLAGQVKLQRLSTVGKEKVIEIVGPGGTVGEAFIFLSPPATPSRAQH